MSERKAAMSAGQQFIKDKGYSHRTQVKPSWTLLLLTEHKYLAEKQHCALIISMNSGNFLLLQNSATIEANKLNIGYNLSLSYFSCRSKCFLQELRQPCSSSSSVTGKTRMRPLAPVRPTLLAALPKWNKCPSMPPHCTLTRLWQLSTAWWMMARAKSR